MAFLVAPIAGIKTSIGIFISDLCYAQLSEEKKTAYSQTSREKNRITKEALDNDFTNKFNKWIYETKN
jgi:hypothetical protein